MGYLLRSLAMRSWVSGETLEELGHVESEFGRKFMSATGCAEDDDDG